MVGTALAARLTAPDPLHRRWLRAAILLWMLYGVVLVCCVGVPENRRTQEARVLESAREMIGAGVHGWLIPHLNGAVRLQKPPLANWLTAAGYELFGVSEWSGRLFAAITVWLTVAVTTLIAFEIFDMAIALLAGVMLAGSFLFLRYGLLAETDTLANLWLMVAVYCILRARGRVSPAPSPGTPGEGRGEGDFERRTSPDEPNHAHPTVPELKEDRERQPERQALWLHLSAAAIGIGFMSKASAAFAFLFLVGIAAVDLDWRFLWRWIKCGAPLTLAVVAAPWWLYALHSPEGKIIGKELDDVTSGEDHGKPLYVYLPQMVRDVAPWCALLPVALVQAVMNCRRQRGVLITLVWTLTVFLPLCFIGNRQDHYLVPLMPPLLVVLAWSIVRAMRIEDRWSIAIRWIIAITLLIAALASAGMTFVPHHIHRPLLAIDVTLSATLLAAWVIIGLVWRYRGWAAGTVMAAAVWTIAMPLVLLLWIPTFYNGGPRSAAVRLKQQFGAGPYVFYSDFAYLPLVFQLQQQIGDVTDPASLADTMKANPNTIVISRMPNDPLAHDPAFRHAFSDGSGNQHVDIYQPKR